MKEPTQEQIKEFWEWCGLEYKNIPLQVTGFLSHRYEWVMGKDILPCYPVIDLNNLFTYAVPNLSDIEITKSRHLPTWVVQVSTGKPIVGEFAEAEHKDPALALFWAIWEVMHGS